MLFFGAQRFGLKILSFPPPSRQQGNNNKTKMNDPFNRKQKIADYVSQMRGVAAHKQSQEHVSFEYNTETLIKRSRQSFPQARVRKPTWGQQMGKAARRSVYVKKPKSIVGPSEPKRLTVKEKIQAVQDEVFPKIR